jgi:hypothetical protein
MSAHQLCTKADGCLELRLAVARDSGSENKHIVVKTQSLNTSRSLLQPSLTPENGKSEGGWEMWISTSAEHRPMCRTNWDLQSIDIDNENGVEALHMLLKEVRRKYFEDGRTLYIYRKCKNQQIKSAGAGGFYLCKAQYVGRS